MAEKTSPAERIYTIPLRKEWLKAPANKRANRAVSALKAFLERHMKSNEIKLSRKINDFIWLRGIQKPPPRIRVKVMLDPDGVIHAVLPDEKFEEAKPKKEEKKPEGLKERLEDKIAREKAELEKPKEEPKPEKPKEDKKPEEKKKEEKTKPTQGRNE